MYRQQVEAGFTGQRWTQDVQWEEHGRKIDPAQWGINCLTANTRAPGLATEPHLVHTGSNSGYAALNLALHRGATRILLLGYDMGMDGNRRHWFGAHPAKLEMASNYASFIARFETIDPPAYGLEIWNVTRRTALDHFPRKTLEEVCDLRNSAATDRNHGAGRGTDHDSGSQVASAR